MRAAPIPSSSPFTFFLSPHFPGVFPFLSSLRSLALWRQRSEVCAPWGCAAPPCPCFVFSTSVVSGRKRGLGLSMGKLCLLSPPTPWALAAGTRRALLANSE